MKNAPAPAPAPAQTATATHATAATPDVDRLSLRQSVLVFAVLAFAYFLSSLVRAITATLAPPLEAEFGLHARDLGLLAGGYFFGFACMQLPLGQLLDRWGPKRVELGFLLVAVLGCAGFALAQSFSALLLARVVCGMGVCACLMAPLTAYRRWYAPAQQMRANAWMLMVGALGMVSATLPVQWLLEHIGWRGVFGVLALAVALAMALIAAYIPRWDITRREEVTTAPSAQANASAPQGYAEVWRNRYFRRMAPLGWVSYGGLLAMQTLWAAPWLIKVAGYTPTQAAQALFALQLAMLLAYWLWGWAMPGLARRGYTTNRLLTWGMPLSMALLALLATAGSALSGPGAAVLWVAYCVSASVSALCQPAVGMAFGPHLAGRALSAFNFLIFAGVFSVQWGLGLCIDALRGLGWSEAGAFQGALGAYAVCNTLAYVYFLRAPK